jgi:hypothetical protein
VAEKKCFLCSCLLACKTEGAEGGEGANTFLVLCYCSFDTNELITEVYLFPL